MIEKFSAVEVDIHVNSLVMKLFFFRLSLLWLEFSLDHNVVTGCSNLSANGLNFNA
jgi:hypothetical protein